MCQTVKNTHSNGLIKLLDLSNAFLVEYLLTAISSMPDVSTSVLKQKKYKTDMCSCYKIARFVNYKKGALDSQPQVIKFISCLPMVGGSGRLPPPLKLVVMI